MGFIMAIMVKCSGSQIRYQVLQVLYTSLHSICIFLWAACHFVHVCEFLLCAWC